MARISDSDLESLIVRDFPYETKIAKEILLDLDPFYASKERNRIAAAVLKLSDSSIDQLRLNVTRANNDFRDVIAPAEYPRAFQFGFELIDNKRKMRQILMADWKEYTDWVKGNT